METSVEFLFATGRCNKRYDKIIIPVCLFLIALLALTSCQSSVTVNNSKANQKNMETVVQESGKPITYQEMIKRFDINKDGVLDNAEIEEVQKTLGTRQPTFTQPASRESTIRRALIIPGKSEPQIDDPVLNKYDLNRDGFLDENEINLLKNDLKTGAVQNTKPVKSRKQSTVVTTPVIRTKRNPIVR